VPVVGVSRRVLIGMGICIIALFISILLLYLNGRALEQERQDRQKQVNAAFLTNCMNREHEVGVIYRKLGLPPTGVRCLELPVFTNR